MTAMLRTKARRGKTPATPRPAPSGRVIEGILHEREELGTAPGACLDLLCQLSQLLAALPQGAEAALSGPCPGRAAPDGETEDAPLGHHQQVDRSSRASPGKGRRAVLDHPHTSWRSRSRTPR